MSRWRPVVPHQLLAQSLPVALMGGACHLFTQRCSGTGATGFILPIGAAVPLLGLSKFEQPALPHPALAPSKDPRQ